MGAATGAMTGNREDATGRSAPEMDASSDREAARLREEIAQTRAEMGGTLDALHGKLNPTVLKEQALDQLHEAKETIKAEVKAEIEEAKSAVREATIGRVENMVESAENTVRQTSRSVMSTIRENPVPAAFVGIGLAWLFLGRRAGEGRVSTRAIQRGAGDVASRVGEMAHEAQATLGEKVHQAGDMAHQAQVTIEEKAHRAGEAVSHFASDLGERSRRLENRAEQVYRDNPIAVGAAVLAVGTAVGMAIPISRKEDQWMGRARDQVVHKAQELAHEALGKVEGASKDLGENVTKALSSGEEGAQGTPSQRQRAGQQGQSAGHPRA